MCIRDSFEHLYLDTASSTIDMGFLEACVDVLGAGKIIFGTDMPLLDPWPQLDKVRQTRVSPTALSQIMGGNILRLMGAAS